MALAGRTDSGVHAWAQVASLDFPERSRLDTPQAVQRALNGTLPYDLAVTGAEIVPESFHARFSARKRAYRYLLWNAAAPLPLLRRYSLHVRQKLGIEAMQQAVGLLVGTHDMAAFAGNAMGVPSDEDDESLARFARYTWRGYTVSTRRRTSGRGTRQSRKVESKGRPAGTRPGSQRLLAADDTHDSGYTAGGRDGQTYCGEHKRADRESRPRKGRSDGQTTGLVPPVGRILAGWQDLTCPGF